MTVVQFKHRPENTFSFNNLLSDVFPQMPSLYKDTYKQTVPVNIKEVTTGYILEVVAPGFSKEDFEIQLENNLLTISANKKNEVAEEVKLIRHEYKLQPIKRSFTLDEKMNGDAISAQYVNGVLILNLPKKEEVKPATKQISIQ